MLFCRHGFDVQDGGRVGTGCLAAAIERADVYLAVDGSVAATERRDSGIYIRPARAEASGAFRLYRRHGFEIVGRGLPSHGKDAHMRVYMAKEF